MNRFFANNEHWADRVSRVVLGSGLLVLAFTGQTNWGYLGLIPVLTGIMGNCPLYSLLGISTCPMKQRISKAARTGN